MDEISQQGDEKADESIQVLPRVLSIQSHVVHGYVGNKAAVFPLQLLGFDVDFVNSVQFSCHTGYKFFPSGEVMNGEQLRAILKGLDDNGLLKDGIGYMLTGYIGSESFLEAVLDVLETIRRYNPMVKFVCDPVMGDDDKFYVPPQLAKVYRDTVIPKADVVTPNQFEVEQLTGIKVKTLEDAKNACAALHKMGPAIVFITSAIIEEEGTNNITIFASQRITNEDSDEDDAANVEMWRINCPLIPGKFTGTGDVTASLLLGHLARNPDNLPLVMEKVINTMYVLIERTHRAKGSTVQSTELKLVQSKDVIENPPATYKAQRIM
jgi:pyridoxine kinase